jgi:ankyrin repeat protein
LVRKAANKREYINSLGRSHRTALHIAAVNGNYVAAEFLVKEGANILLPDGDGNTAAMTAAMYYSNSGERGRIMCYLLGLDLTRIDDQSRKDRRTCLHSAAITNSGANVEWLLGKGANAKLKDKDGKTAWELACRSNLIDVMSVFAVTEMEDRQIHPRYPRDGEVDAKETVGSVGYRRDNVPIRGMDPGQSSWLFIHGNSVSPFSTVPKVKNADIEAQLLWTIVCNNRPKFWQT